MNFVLTLSHVVTIKMVFSYHSEADPRSKEEINFFLSESVPGYQEPQVYRQKKNYFSSHLIE